MAVVSIPTKRRQRLAGKVSKKSTYKLNVPETPNFLV